MSGVVSDASPLIALHQIGQLGLLGTIFGRVLIPPAVAREAPGIGRPAWLLVRSLEKPVAPAVVDAGLGQGESEAISLALELGAERVILDDLPARVIPSVREPIDALRAGRFRVATDLYEQLLTKAGER